MNAAEDLAKKRFFTLQALRLAGTAMALAGLLVVARKLDWHIYLGYFLLLNGAFDALLLPPLLAKRWRTPKP